MPEKGKEVCLKSASGSIMMSIEALGREGDRIVIHGKMLSSWPSEIYIDLEDVLKMIRLLISPAVCFYIFSLPFWVLKRKFNSKPPSPS
jgi:hypothetical protein